MWLTSRSINTFEKYAISVSIRCSSNKDSCLYFSAACFIALAVISFAVDSVGNSRTLTCNVTSWWGGRQSTFKCKSTIQWLPNERNVRFICTYMRSECHSSPFPSFPWVQADHWLYTRRWIRSRGACLRPIVLPQWILLWKIQTESF